MCFKKISSVKRHAMYFSIFLLKICTQKKSFKFKLKILCYKFARICFKITFCIVICFHMERVTFALASVLHEGTLWHGETFAWTVTIARRLFCTSITLARGESFARYQLHGGPLLHKRSFLHKI